MQILAVAACFVTILGAIVWLYKERENLLNWASCFIPRSKKIGVKRFYNNRKIALNILYEELKDSSSLRVMNLKGYSVVEESDIPDTFLDRILSESKTIKKVEILIHFPDSPAIEARIKELGDGYSSHNMIAEHKSCMRKIEEINRRHLNIVNLRLFQEPVALWNIVIWDRGILLGWYPFKSPSHKGHCIQLDKNSILADQVEKYFDSIWFKKSVSFATHRALLPFFPSSSSYPTNIAAFEALLFNNYNRSPSQKNAFVIYIGGGAGTGKSTLAVQLANLLGVRNILSTDMIRQTLRQSDGASQIIKDETWDAWRNISDIKTVDALYEGLKKQANLLGPMVTSVAEYALHKGMSTIIEGIHILPDANIVEHINGAQNLLFFLDATDEQIEKNFEMRKHSTHMRTVREGFASLEDRIALHAKMIKLTREKKLKVVTGDNWDEIINSAKNVITQYFNLHFP